MDTRKKIDTSNYFTFVMGEDLKEKTKKIAAEQGRTLAGYIRWAIKKANKEITN